MTPETRHYNVGKINGMTGHCFMEDERNSLKKKTKVLSEKLKLSQREVGDAKSGYRAKFCAYRPVPTHFVTTAFPMLSSHKRSVPLSTHTGNVRS